MHVNKTFTSSTANNWESNTNYKTCLSHTEVR